MKKFTRQKSSKQEINRQITYHVAAHNVLPFAVSPSDLWRACVQATGQCHRNHQWVVHAFVVMGNHLHALMAGSDFRVEILLREIAQQLSSSEAVEAEERTLCRAINCYSDYRNAYRYIYRNPLEQGWVERVEDYHFSSLQIVLGRQKTAMPIVDHMNLINHPARVLAWLNQS